MHINSLTDIPETSSCEEIHINDDEVAQCTETHACPHNHPSAEDEPSLTTSTSSSASATFFKSQQNSHDKPASELVYYENFLQDNQRMNVELEVKEGKVLKSLEDYYANFGSKKAKELIDSLFLSRNEICPDCARFYESPVYSDRYVYKKLPLLAKEAKMIQTSRTSVILQTQYFSESFLDFMPIYKFMKPNAAGIFYTVCLAPDLTDLKSSLEPSIVLLEKSNHFSRVEKSKVQIFHKIVDKGYNRISEKGIIAPIFSPSKIKDVTFEFKVDMNLESESHKLLKEMVNHEDRNNFEQDGENLVTLVPLLQVLSETTNAKFKFKKNSLSHSEHINLMKIIITYVSTFIFLLSLTFYLVYFY